MSPARAPSFIPFLPQYQPKSETVPLELGLRLTSDVPAPEIDPAKPPVKEPNFCADCKKSESPSKRSLNIRLRSSDSEVKNEPETKRVLNAPTGTRVLLSSLKDPAEDDEVKGPLKEEIDRNEMNLTEIFGSYNKRKATFFWGFCGELDEDQMERIGKMDILEIFAMKGIHIEPPSWHRHGGYSTKGIDPLEFDLLREVLCFTKKLDNHEMKRIAEMDVLEIVALKGIHFEPPSWHRPGGYDAKKPRKCTE